jgi:hypothetical protein
VALNILISVPQRWKDFPGGMRMTKWECRRT